ncbi:MAG: tyrosine-protein phosphatase [Clostridiaceae bacterium]|nr:tyrosine-protein phosphatase [Clostridiaceae bacterium]
MSKGNSQISKISNLRELGGYRTKDGLRVKSNLLYRSGDLNFPTDLLAQSLEPLNISLVFDLRSSDEATSNAYSLPESIQYRHRPVLASFEKNSQYTNFELPDLEAMRKGGRQPFSQDEIRFLGGFMTKVYQEMGERAEVFGDIMKEMAENGGTPVLFHCSAGKDRTGVLATLILLALGVSMEDAMEHYLLSNTYRKEEINEEMQKIASLIDDPVLLNQIGDMLLVKEEYLDTTLKAVRAYPVFEDYAGSRLGLEREDLETLRVLYLE